ncbi:MAG: TRAP transporter small permease subunit [Bacillota bacterium]|nr:TRAP transporter small permease subunit [Bacillota bacterium]
MLDKVAKILKFIDLISEQTGKLTSYLVLIMVGFQVVEVFRRYVLEEPTTWSWEFVTLLYGAHFILGGAWLLKEGGHVRTDVFYDRFSPKIKALLDLIFFTTIFFVFAYVMTSKVGANALYSYSINEKTYTMWAPPFWPLKMVFTYGFLLLLLQGVAKWIRDLIFVIKGEQI